jgi:xanthine dehydrogenase accessory factor
MEDDLIYRYTMGNTRNAIASSSPEVARYGVSAEEAHRFGLSGGGTLELLLEFDPPLDSLDVLLRRLEAGELVRRIVDRNSGTITLEHADRPKDLLFVG